MFSIGIFNCVITQRMDRCIHFQIGQISMEEHGLVEIWTSFSEAGLRTLQHDLIFQPPDRFGFAVMTERCCITGQVMVCIQALIAVLPEQRNGVPTGREALIHATFSREGIDRLLGILSQSQELPLDLPGVQEQLLGTPYGWSVMTRDTRLMSQYPISGGETLWRDVPRDQIELLIIEPRDWNGPLPWYRLSAVGFERSVTGEEPELLPIPMPGEPFEYRYYRQVTITFACEAGTGQPLTPRLVQVIGWRIWRPSHDLICELGVEENGIWSIYRRGRLSAEDVYLPMLEDEFQLALATGRAQS